MKGRVLLSFGSVFIIHVAVYLHFPGNVKLVSFTPHTPPDLEARHSKLRLAILLSTRSVYRLTYYHRKQNYAHIKSSFWVISRGFAKNICFSGMALLTTYKMRGNGAQLHSRYQISDFFCKFLRNRFFVNLTP